MWVSQHLSIAVYRTGTANTSPRPAMLGSYSLESIEQYSYLFLERTVRSSTCPQSSRSRSVLRSLLSIVILNIIYCCESYLLFYVLRLEVKFSVFKTFCYSVLATASSLLEI